MQTVAYYVDGPNNAVTAVAGAAMSGPFNMPPVLADGDDVTAGHMFNAGVAYIGDRAGNYINSDRLLHKIRKIDGTSHIISAWVGGGGNSISTVGPATSAEIGENGGIAYFNSNLYFVSETLGGLYKVDASGILSVMVTADTNGSGDTGDGGASTAAIMAVSRAVYVETVSNKLYFSTGACHLRVIDLGTGIINTVAGGAANCNGASGSGVPATAANIVQPNIHADTVGNIFLLERSYTVRQITPDHIITTIAGQLGWGPNNGVPAAGAATSAQLNDITYYTGITGDTAGL